MLLHFMWLLLLSWEKVPTLERSRQEVAVLSATCCRWKLQGLFSTGHACRTLCWFQGQSQLLATCKPRSITVSASPG